MAPVKFQIASIRLVLPWALSPQMTLTPSSGQRETEARLRYPSAERERTFTG